MEEGTIRFPECQRQPARYKETLFPSRTAVRRTFRQSAVANLTSANARHAAHFTHRKRRKVVMQHETLALFPLKGFQTLHIIRVPRVTVTSAWVSPRVNSAEPWVRRSTPTSNGNLPDLNRSCAGRAVRAPGHLLAEDSLPQRLEIL